MSTFRILFGDTPTSMKMPMFKSNKNILLLIHLTVDCDTVLRMCGILISGLANQKSKVDFRWRNPLPSTLRGPRKLLYHYRRGIWSILKVLNDIFCIFVQVIKKFEVIPEKCTKPYSLLPAVMLKTNEMYMWRLMWSSGFHFCLLSFSSQRSTFPGWFLNGKCIKKVENWLPRYSRGRTDDLGCYAAWISIVCNNNIYSLVWLGTEGENPAIFSCTGSRVSLEERINRTWKVLTDIRFMTLAWSYAKQAARSPKWYIWNLSCTFAVWYMFNSWRF